MMSRLLLAAVLALLLTGCAISYGDVRRMSWTMRHPTLGPMRPENPQYRIASDALDRDVAGCEPEMQRSMDEREDWTWRQLQRDAWDALTDCLWAKGWRWDGRTGTGMERAP